VAAISNNTYLNILASYAYIGNSKRFEETIFANTQNGRINAMLDSGAYTLHSTKTKKSFLNIDDYCTFLEKKGHYFEKYVNFDVINNDKQSKDNYEKMLFRGFNPMFVFTNYDTDFKYLQYAAEQNEHICVSGGQLSNRKWLLKRYQDVYKYTKGKLHGLAFVKYPDMLQVPLHSVDSSTWVLSAGAFGNLNWFDNGIKGMAYIEVLKNKRSMPKVLTDTLDRFKVSVKEFSNLQNHRNGRSIGVMLSIIAYLEYQKYCKKNNLNLFLACGNNSQVDNILFVDEHLNNNTLTYEKFKKKNSY
jgi:hypothetical protein